MADSTLQSMLELLPHRPPMRLVEELVELVPGGFARARRTARPDDWYFQGHFPADPVVPAIVLVELLAQTGGLAAAAAVRAEPAPPVQLRVAALGRFKFPAAAAVGSSLEATARVVGMMGSLIRIEGQVTADGRRVAEGSLTLAEVRS